MPSTSRRADDRMSVLVCRGCCCGTVAKHPGVDHEGHLDRLRTSMEDVHGARLFTVDCLDLCAHSNVVVVRAGGRRRWFGEMLDDSLVGSLGEWLAGGGESPVPPELEARTFDPEQSPTPKGVIDGRRGAELTAWMNELMRSGGVWTSSERDGEPVSVADDTRAFAFDQFGGSGAPALIVFARVGAVADVELPPGIELPKGFVPVAIHSPLPG